MPRDLPQKCVYHPSSFSRVANVKTLRSFEENGYITLEHRRLLVQTAIYRSQVDVLEELLTFVPGQKMFILALRTAANNPKNTDASTVLDMIIEKGKRFNISPDDVEDDPLNICIKANNTELFDWCLSQNYENINRNDPIYHAMLIYRTNPYFFQTLLQREDIVMYPLIVQYLIFPYILMTGTWKELRNFEGKRGTGRCEALANQCMILGMILILCVFSLLRRFG